jgi:integrase
MPRKPRIPSYRRHASGQARVTLNGIDHLLGRYGSNESREAYNRLIAEWLAGRDTPPMKEERPPLTINEVMLAYWKHAVAYYGFDRSHRGDEYCLRDALRVLRLFYGSTPASNFGPKSLKVVRQQMIEKGWSRTYTNAQIDRIRRMFRWAAEEELLPGQVHQDLRTVSGLRSGKTEARETNKVRPVPTDRLDASLQYMSSTVQDMVRLQLLTGCRPDEVCRLRPIDIDMRNSLCWLYRPGSDEGSHGTHKTSHHGHDRIILIGPQGQEVLRPYLNKQPDAYCFSPQESEAARYFIRHAKRRSPMTASQTRRRQNQNRRRPPGARYDTHGYRRAIKRACDAAFPPPLYLARRKNESRNAWLARLTPEQRSELQAWRKQHRWSPNQLRHNRATELRPYGLDLTKTILGHSKVETSLIYAERDLAAAMELVARIG